MRKCFGWRMANAGHGTVQESATENLNKFTWNSWLKHPVVTLVKPIVLTASCAKSSGVFTNNDSWLLSYCVIFVATSAGVKHWTLIVGYSRSIDSHKYDNTAWNLLKHSNKFFEIYFNSPIKVFWQYVD